MPDKIDVTGLIFGRLTVLDRPDIKRRGRRHVTCQCICGNEAIVEPRSLRAGDVTSCGCAQRDAVGAAASARSTHGMSRKGKRAPEYNIWIKLKSRCQNPSDKKYKDYGGRGIAVCERWSASFENFISDMGNRPEGASSIDRIDVNGNYEPSNCRWSNPKEQSRNKRNHRNVVYDGVTMPLSQACELAGINYRSALYRLNAGKDWLPAPPTSHASQVLGSDDNA